jgi:uncharacterized protein
VEDERSPCQLENDTREAVDLLAIPNHRRRELKVEAVSDPTPLRTNAGPEVTGASVWIDIDNPAQVQYLLRFQAAFTKLGMGVLLTARASGMTAKMIEGNGATATIVGGELGRSKVLKAAGTIRRAISLAAICRSRGRPAIAISSSRAAAIASWRLGVSHFALLDYEYVDLSVYRRTGCWVLHPEIIRDDFFVARGLKRPKLMPFPGLKEDITFSTLDPAPLRQPTGRAQLTHVLVRPPAEQSHYFVAGSSEVTRNALDLLSKRSDVQVLFSPRRASQSKYLEGLSWATDPILIDGAAPFLDLLSRADAVVSAGGTMLREAAYLGIPAFSTFQGTPGSVDLHLASEGRLTFIRSAEDLQAALSHGAVRRPPMTPHPGLVDELISAMVAASSATAISDMRMRSIK